jgi:hypothetical protein
MILASLLAAAAVSQAPAPLAVSRTLAVRAQVVASCTASLRETACQGAARAAPLSRRYETAEGDRTRLVIDY